MHRVKSDITASEENADQKPTHLASSVCISTEAPEGNKETTIQDSDDNEKFEKVFHLDVVSYKPIRTNLQGPSTLGYVSKILVIGEHTW
jgi:hypothetical protein